MRSLVAFVAAFAFSVEAASAANVTLPDLRTGNVHGLTGLLYWPADPPAPNGEPRPLPTADGCEVHMVPHSDFDRELRYPCGKWFVLPATDRYNFWLETNGHITASMSMLVFAPKPFEGRGVGAIVAVTPAGRVAIPADHAIADSESLRLLSIEKQHSWADRIFERRVQTRDAASAIQMPEGRVVVGRFDRKTNDAIALSRPVEAKAGTTMRVWPANPVDSDLLVVLSKPPELQLSRPADVHLTLDDDTTKKPPDVLVNGFDRIIAIWYGITARTAALSLESSVAFWAPQQVRFMRGKVTTIRSRITRLPKVNVSVNVPSGASVPEPLSLDVIRAAEKESLRHLAIRAGVQEVDALPAEALRVMLTVDRWKFAESVDLSSGNDAQVSFDLEPIAVRGTVFHGDQAVPAELAFRNGDEWIRVQTDDRGEYETTFWSPDAHTVRVTLKGTNLPPFLDAFREISHSGTVDFHVPRTDYVVRVRDASTGGGVANAQVIAGNQWTDESSRPHVAAQHVTTDEAGVAILPPLQKGELIVDVRAEHYASREPLHVAVDEKHHELDIDLQPLRTAATLHLLLPNGAPAANAEVWAFTDAMQPLWRGASKDDGSIEIPEIAANALLLVRHLNAATTVRRVDPAKETWTLDAPAEPLTLVAEKTQSIALWIDGVKLAGPPLAFAAWSSPVTNPSGVWIGRNLPAKALQFLVLPLQSNAASAYDALAQHVDYPWPPSVAVQKTDP